MKSGRMKFNIFTLFLFILTLISTPLCIGKVIFEDDFEKNVIDKGKWTPTEVGLWRMVFWSLMGVK